MTRLGSIVRDKITGFTGVAMGRCEYLTGCHQVLILPQKLDKDGKRQEGEWFDEQRVEDTGKIIKLDNPRKLSGADERKPSRNR